MAIPDRLVRLRAALSGAGCQALLVTDLVNIRYLTGFSGSAAQLLVMADDLLLATDGRYGEQAADELRSARVEARIAVGNPVAQREAIIAATGGIATVGLEAGSVTWARQREFAAEWFPGAELVATDGLVEELRRVKDGGEVARIAEAARIADAALASVKSLLLDGVSEADFAIALDFEMRRLGAADVSFDSIVAGGPNGARPHARPSSRPVQPGELVVLDFGALVDGYHSDMTRTVCVGEPSSATLRRMVDVVLESQQAGVASVADGVPCRDVDRACRDVITEAGWGDAFVHGTGHGVGLLIHEAPWVGSTSTDTLAAGHVVTVEPGVYLPEHGGVRIEDTVVVTESGCEPLTHAPKDLVIA